MMVHVSTVTTDWKDALLLFISSLFVSVETIVHYKPEVLLAGLV